MASQEAVMRRRANRKAARQAKVRAAAPAGTWESAPAAKAGGRGVEGMSATDLWYEKQQHEREAACLLARRFFPSHGTGWIEMPLIVLDYLFWQALRADIDMLSPVIWDGVSDPRDTSAWRFWCSLHYETRQSLVIYRKDRNCRRRN
jgi:hypothetical protein